MNPGTLIASLKAMKAGFRQTKTMGDATQQGGVFAITPGGDMPYRYISKYAGDHPPPEKSVAKVEELTRRG